jgi:hypothetical protein
MPVEVRVARFLYLHAKNTVWVYFERLWYSNFLREVFYKQFGAERNHLLTITVFWYGGPKTI